MEGSSSNQDDIGIVQIQSPGNVTVIHPQDSIIGIAEEVDEAQENYREALRLHRPSAGGGN